MFIDKAGERRPAILLIDGHADEAALMEAQFHSVDVPAKLHFVSDGEEAIEFLLQNDRYREAPRPALILLDMKLARDGGFEMLSMAKRDDKYARIPFIVLTTSSGEDVEQAYFLQANCCVRKPESAAELAHFVNFVKAFWLEMMTLPD